MKKNGIAKELKAFKVLKKRVGRTITVSRLKTIKGFESLTDELAEKVIQQLQEYTMIILGQISRLNKLK